MITLSTSSLKVIFDWMIWSSKFLTCCFYSSRFLIESLPTIFYCVIVYPLNCVYACSVMASMAYIASSSSLSFLTYPSSYKNSFWKLIVFLRCHSFSSFTKSLMKSSLVVVSLYIIQRKLITAMMIPKYGLVTWKCF